MSDIKDFDLVINNTFYSDESSYLSKGFLLPDDNVFCITSSYTHHYFHNPEPSSYQLLVGHIERENFYITAIRNLIKQKKYLNLLYELSNDYISVEEFNEELENNEDEYLIRANNSISSKSKVESLMNVLSKIDLDFDEEDLLEIFSIAGTGLDSKSISYSYSACIINDKTRP